MEYKSPTAHEEISHNIKTQITENTEKANCIALNQVLTVVLVEKN